MFVVSRRTPLWKHPPSAPAKNVALIAEGNQRMRLFIQWLRTHPDPRVRNDPDVRRLVCRWDAKRTFVRPIPPSEGVAAYTRNKGTDLMLCVPDDEKESKDYNTMTFVLEQAVPVPPVDGQTEAIGVVRVGQNIAPELHELHVEPVEATDSGLHMASGTEQVVRDEGHGRSRGDPVLVGEDASGAG
ncbi:hypothetical protein KFL_009350090 [Klebsormidium nitens]|uniref:Uncharacterized protein n=1 Tax=Klebsormidium nitens TaxID=105231 RepID=A0A1Y1IQ46_KLENI|nr:hypothetical protein KFL_009350090 [Klebsormidium nitens]|eukprot:GAQ92162.1 hypothetical protein KFL_009350090 [Klebsormidium nitens]